MGFLSKAFKSVKKVFKKVGKAIKSGLKSVGKFMDKIGIVGQIGLSLLLPGIGSALSGMWGSLVGGMQAYSGIGSTIINGAGNFLNAETQVASRAGRAFSSITEGVKNVVGETLKVGANKLGLGEVATNLGFTDLGSSISNASFDSIGEAFNLSKDKFLSSFSGDAFLPDSAYEAARNRAMMTPEQREFIGGVQNFEVTPEVEAQRLREFEDVQNMYDTDSYTRGVTVGADTPDLYGPGFDPARQGVTVGVDTPDLYGPNAPQRIMEQDAFMEAREKALEDLPSVGEQPSLLSRAEDAAVSGGRQIGSALQRGAVKGAESSAVSFMRQQTGVEQPPEYETTYYGAYVPTLDLSADIGMRTAAFNPVQFGMQNQDFINMYPFGASAQLYNDMTYLQNMEQYGMRQV